MADNSAKEPSAMSTTELESYIASTPDTQEDNSGQEPVLTEQVEETDNSNEPESETTEKDTQEKEENQSKQSDNATAPDTKLTEEKFKNDPMKLEQSYKELQSTFTKQQQEFAELRKWKEAEESRRLAEEQKRLDAERVSSMSDQEREIEELRRQLVYPVVEQIKLESKQEVEKIRQERALEKQTDIMALEVAKLDTYVNNNPTAKPFKEILWQLANNPNIPPDSIQSLLPENQKGKPYTALPFDTIFDAVFGQAIQLGKQEAISKVEDKVKKQPLGTKSSGAGAEPDYKNMSTEEMEKILPRADY